jgi:branched-chain amino acid transport system permease protein
VDLQTFFTYLVLGATVSAVYAISASGLVVTYITSGIFNFAHGAVGMFLAFVYWQLRVDLGWPTPLGSSSRSACARRSSACSST